MYIPFRVLRALANDRIRILSKGSEVLTCNGQEKLKENVNIVSKEKGKK